jgi:hypothetical protein
VNYSNKLTKHYYCIKSIFQDCDRISKRYSKT